MNGIDWARARLVVFDVDGTLYDQSKLRRAMAVRLAADAILRRRLTPLTVLRTFRRRRELLAEEGAVDFETRLFDEVATAHRLDPPAVRALVSEWMERRPLPLLSGCTYPGVAACFEAVRASGRKLGILSDYPAREKMAAMGLDADYIVSACDPEIMRLKPDPAGLVHLIGEAGEQPSTTLMVGDRAERDGEIARRIGAQALLRGEPADGHPGFSDFSALAARLRAAPLTSPVHAAA